MTHMCIGITDGVNSIHYRNYNEYIILIEVLFGNPLRYHVIVCIDKPCIHVTVITRYIHSNSMQSVCDLNCKRATKILYIFIDNMQIKKNN